MAPGLALGDNRSGPGSMSRPSAADSPGQLAPEIWPATIKDPAAVLLSEALSVANLN